MIRNFNHAMSSGISNGTGAESDVGGGEASWRISAALSLA